jgi:hypothetical protein
MLLLAAAVATIATWVPMRWPTADPASLALLKDTPINCLLLEPQNWSPQFTAKAHEQGIATVGITTQPWDPKAAAHLDAILSAAPAQSSTIPVYPLAPRTSLDFNKTELIATPQGVWPGVNPTPDDHAKAAPSGGPWIDTNAGFLRFARALTNKPIWIANTPPPNKAYPISRYLQVTAEAAMCGAKWVIALDADLQKRLLANDANALRDWRILTTQLAFLETHKAKLTWPASGQLTLIQDPKSGALLSGGILDMIAIKHTPVRPLPAANILPGKMRGALMAVNVDPKNMSESEREHLAQFTRSGGTVLTGPKDWQFPTPRDGQITLDEKELTKLDAIWKEVNALTGRRNLGARLFNVGTMLSNLTESPDATRRVLHLVNYTDFPVEAITAHMLGKWKRATLHQPGKTPKGLEVYPTEDGTGIDIPEMAWYAILEVE